MNRVNYLYIHIPFCISKCSYCDFYSEPISIQSEIIPNYIEALCKEIELKKDIAKNLKTIYIGGGTPSLLSFKDVSNILDFVDKSFGIEKNAEITLEINPKTIKIEKLKEFRQLGINRLSIGVQSFNDDELSILGRIHNADDASEAIELSRKAGFENISIDLIYGIPDNNGLNKKDFIRKWNSTLRKTLDMQLEHISTYELTLEKDTKLKEYVASGRFKMPEEETIEEIYFLTIDELKTKGYEHYEISNFSKTGYECIHNLNYWNRGQYLGIGAGAHSFYNNKRVCNLKDYRSYIKILQKWQDPVSDEIELKKEDELKELIILGLRKTEGLELARLKEEDASLLREAISFLPHGIVKMNDRYVRLTKEGLILSNEIIVRILLYIEQNPL